METDDSGGVKAEGAPLELGYVDGMHYVAVVTSTGCEEGELPGTAHAPNLKTRRPKEAQKRKKEEPHKKGKGTGWTEVQKPTQRADRTKDRLLMEEFASGVHVLQEGELRAGRAVVEKGTVALWTGSIVDALLQLKRHTGLTLLTNSPVKGATTEKVFVHVEMDDGVVEVKKWASSWGTCTKPIVVNAETIPVVVFAAQHENESLEQTVERVQRDVLAGDSLVSVREVDGGIEGIIHVSPSLVEATLQVSGENGTHIRVLAEKQDAFPVSCLWEDTWGVTTAVMQAALQRSSVVTLGLGRRHSGGTSLRVHTRDLPKAIAALKEGCVTRRFELYGILPRYQAAAIEKGLAGIGWDGVTLRTQQNAVWYLEAPKPPPKWAMKLFGSIAWIRDITGHPRARGRGGGATTATTESSTSGLKEIRVKAKMKTAPASGERRWADVAGNGKQNGSTPRQQQRHPQQQKDHWPLPGEARPQQQQQRQQPQSDPKVDRLEKQVASLVDTVQKVLEGFALLQKAPEAPAAPPPAPTPAPSLEAELAKLRQEMRQEMGAKMNALQNEVDGQRVAMMEIQGELAMATAGMEQAQEKVQVLTQEKEDLKEEVLRMADELKKARSKVEDLQNKAASRDRDDGKDPKGGRRGREKERSHQRSSPQQH